MLYPLTWRQVIGRRVIEASKSGSKGRSMHVSRVVAIVNRFSQGYMNE
jgi:hypothetical protein